MRSERPETHRWIQLQLQQRVLRHRPMQQRPARCCPRMANGGTVSAAAPLSPSGLTQRIEDVMLPVYKTERII